MNVVTAGMPRAPIAADRTKTKINQKPIAPISFDGFDPGLIFSAY